MATSKYCGVVYSLCTTNKRLLQQSIGRIWLCRQAIISSYAITKELPSSLSIKQQTNYLTQRNNKNSVLNRPSGLAVGGAGQLLFLQIQNYSHVKKPNIQITTIRGKELIKDALEIRKERFLEKKDDFVKDIKDTKSRVAERVKVKIEEMEEIVERENVMTIPNLLCVGRGLLSPYLAYVIVEQDYKFAMGLLLFAGFTDLMDGYIARNWPSQASKMGSFLDPMADKLLVGALVISLSYGNLFPVWLCGMVLFRDVFLIGAGFIIRYISLPPPKTLSRYFDVTHATAQLEPTFISKVNTAVQLVAIATSLGAPIWSYIDHPALHGLWYFTGLTTVAAALSYVISKDTYKIIKETKRFK